MGRTKKYGSGIFMLCVRKMATLALLMCMSVSSVYAEDRKFSLVDGLKVVELEDVQQKLSAFNVSSETLGEIQQLVEHYSVTLSSSYSIHDLNVLLYVFDSQSDFGLLPNNFREPDPAETVTGPFTAKTVVSTKADGSKHSFTLLIAVRELAPEMTDIEFSCGVVKAASAALISSAHGTEFLAILSVLKCNRLIN